MCFANGFKSNVLSIRNLCNSFEQTKELNSIKGNKMKKDGPNLDARHVVNQTKPKMTSRIHTATN